MAENYVKFRRGTSDEFKAITPDSDTLYFIENSSLNTFELYLGSKKITDGVEGGGTASPVSLSLNDLTDVVIQNVGDGHVLVYDDISKKWENKSVADVIEDAISNLSTNITITITNSENKTHSELFPTKRDINNNLVNGDILIIKDKIGNETNKYQHTAYVFYNNEWTAMDGNYDAENVYFDEDLIVTTKVGTITSLTNGQATLAAKGKNLKQVLSSLLAKQTEPTVTQPSAKISLTNGGIYEVGTIIAPAWKTTFSKGSYSFGPDTAVEDAGAIISFTGLNETSTIAAGAINGASGSFATKIEIADGETYIATLTYGWNDSPNMPKDNLGNESSVVSKIVGKSNQTTTSGTISGYRAWFWGGLTDAENISRDTLKKSDAKITDITFDLIAADYENCNRIVIAIPVADNKKVSKVLLKSASNADITSEFKPNTLNIPGANGYKEKPYNVWIYQPASLDSTEEYTITIN